MRILLSSAVVLLVVALFGPAEEKPEAVASKGPHRSPVDLALSADGKLALTANEGADSISLVDLDRGKVLDEAKAGKKPSAVALSRDGKRAAVSNLWSHSVSLYEVKQGKLTRLAEVAIGAFPRGLIFSKDGGKLFVCVAGEDRIAVLDWNARKVEKSLPAEREPRHLALSADGRLLACVSSKNYRIRCFDLANDAKLFWERKVFDGFNLREMAFSPDGADLYLVHVVDRARPVSHANIAEGWVIDARLTKFAVNKKLPPDSWQLALDERGEGFGDPHGVALDATKGRIILSAAGSHELMMLDLASIPWSEGDPGDHMPLDFTYSDKVRRYPIGGRPMTIALRPGGRQLVVANHLLDAVQVIELPASFDKKLKPTIREIALGGPANPDRVRRGEALFYDAQLSHAQWFSCHTCHVDGHTNSLAHDTLNDETFGNDKLTPTLRGVARTAPFTWHGWQGELDDAVKKSLTETLFGPEPKKQQVEDLVAYLKTLDHPPHPFRDRLDPKAIARGKDLFANKAGCARCHRGDDYITRGNHDLGLRFLDGSSFRKWNTPALIGLYDRGPYMHDGRAPNLEHLLELHHKPEDLGGAKLTEPERRDLIVFLKSL